MCPAKLNAHKLNQFMILLYVYYLLSLLHLQPTDKAIELLQKMEICLSDRFQNLITINLCATEYEAS